MNTDLRYTTITGKEFNRVYQGYKFYKIIPSCLSSHGFNYQYGLNIDTNEFNPSGSCNEGGIYFTDGCNVSKYQNYGDVIVDVTIPDDAQVYIESDKFKADRIILENFRHLNRLPQELKRIPKQFDFELLVYGALFIGFSMLGVFYSKKK
jgi:hypothetical protein